MGIEHRYTTPRAKGEVERQNRSLLKSMRAAHAEGKNWREELNKFHLVHRSTPHSTTGKSPAELLFRRKVRIKMPELVNVEEEEVEATKPSVIGTLRESSLTRTMLTSSSMPETKM